MLLTCYYWGKKPCWLISNCLESDYSGFGGLWWMVSLQQEGKATQKAGRGSEYGESWHGILSDIAKCYWRLQIQRQTYSRKKGIKSTYQLFNQQLTFFIKWNAPYIVDVFSTQINVFDPCFEKLLDQLESEGENITKPSNEFLNQNRLNLQLDRMDY